MKIPWSYRGRLRSVGRANGFPSGAAFAEHLVERGLRKHDDGGGALDARLRAVVDTMGYSSERELIEHLLDRGLDAYATRESDPAAFEARLRGLGYID